MKHRIFLVALFLLPALWGAGSIVTALAVSSDVTCPGENVGEDGEEHPGPMRPGDTSCAVLDGDVDVATRTYEEQQRAQSVARRHRGETGVLLLAYGAVGGLVAGFSPGRGSGGA